MIRILKALNSVETTINEMDLPKFESAILHTLAYILAAVEMGVMFIGVLLAAIFALILFKF